ncbi:MAG TPA: outer membrane beta-barrel protein [Edaphocola sp.]|nr:outer membrane beta-barrel protein [Edaphocola sp.]
MKKVILLTLFLFIGNIIVKAQNIYFGINCGYLKNISLTKDYRSTPQYLKFSRDKALLPSYNWGINFGYKFRNHWSLETQLQFVQIRYKETIDVLYHLQSGIITSSGFAEIDWYHNIAYSRIPVLAKYNFFSPLSKIDLSLIVGPDFGFLIKQTSDYRGVNELGIENQNSLDFEEIPLKQFDFGFQFGIRVESKIKKSLTTFIEVSVYQGFFNIIDMPERFYNSRSPYYENINMVNRHFTANFGIQYNLAHF